MYPHAIIRAGLGLFLGFIMASGVTAQELLEVEIVGLEGELEKNTRAWLGVIPDSVQGRANFLARANSRVEQGLQALGYYRAVIEPTVDRDASPWRLTITVVPGEPVRLREVDIRLTGEAASDQAFAKLFTAPGLAEGDVLHHGRYQQFKRRVESLALQRGYFDAAWHKHRVAVEPVAGTADLALHYQSGPRYRFGELQYEQDFLHEEVLEPLVETRPGEPYDQALLARTQAALQRTGYFSMVLLRPEPRQAEGGEMPLSMELHPAPRHNFDLGVGFSTDTRERASITWRTPRINRAGHSQETRVQASRINPSGSVTYSIPLGHPLNDLLQTRLRVEENEFGDLSSHQRELGVRREIKKNDWIYSYSLRALHESWRAGDLDNEESYLLPGFSLSNRRRKGSPVNPDSGFSQFYQVEAAHNSLGSDVNLLRLSANFAYISSPAERHRLVLRSELGAALIDQRDRPELAPSLGFFAGGSQSLRGFSYQSIGNEIRVPDDDGELQRVVVGGNRLATASAEYQYQFREAWRGAVFVDAGDAFDDGDFNANYAVGVGVHYMTPVGAMRLELAYPFSEDSPSPRIHIGVGAEF